MAVKYNMLIIVSLSIEYLYSCLTLGFFWSSGGRTIIFTETKESASQLAEFLPGARALHGDIQQSQREVNCFHALFYLFFIGYPEKREKKKF